MKGRRYVPFSQLRSTEQLQLFHRLYHRSIGELVDHRLDMSSEFVAVRTLLVLCRFVLLSGNFSAELKSRIEGLNLSGLFDFEISAESLREFGDICPSNDKTHYTHLTRVRRDVAINHLDKVPELCIYRVYGSGVVLYHNRTGWSGTYRHEHSFLDEDDLLGICYVQPGIIVWHRSARRSIEILEQLREGLRHATSKINGRA